MTNPPSADQTSDPAARLPIGTVALTSGSSSILLTWRLNSQRRHAGLDPASSALLDSRLRGNDESRVFIRRSNNIPLVVVLVIGHCLLKFICNLVLEIWNFNTLYSHFMALVSNLFRPYPDSTPKHLDKPFGFNYLTYSLNLCGSGIIIKLISDSYIIKITYYPCPD
jgi:hypothetical protein